MRLRSTSAKIALIPLAAMGALDRLSSGRPGGRQLRRPPVKAVETDFHIALSKKTFGPGTYTFVAINKGKTTHALEITGPGLHSVHGRHLPRPERQAQGRLQERGQVRHLLPRARPQDARHERQPEGLGHGHHRLEEHHDRPRRPAEPAPSATEVTPRGAHRDAQPRPHLNDR